MRTYKRLLPEGVRKIFDISKGRKIRVINILYCKKHSKKEQ